MVSGFDWFAIVIIFAVAVAGGFKPLTQRETAGSSEGFPLGQAFSAGVFLALSLIIMLPNGFHLFSKAFPNIHYPLASAVALTSFIILLALGHVAYFKSSHRMEEQALTTPAIPIIMTIMIAIPSFLLGTALGVSEESMAIIILVAILLHKGSAGFALALAMVRSTLTKGQSFALFALFACSTPVGILLGADVHQYLVGNYVLIIKACTLSLAAGVFLYMGTLHEMKHAPLIIHCCTWKGFIAMVAGLVLTAFVRVLLGTAHTGHPG
jgi:zinc transporter ZupT